MSDLPQPKPFLSLSLKARLRIIAVSLLAVAGSWLWFAGVDSEFARADQEAFDAYAHFAKQMHAETHKPETHKASHETHKAHDTVWAALAMRGK